MKYSLEKKIKEQVTETFSLLDLMDLLSEKGGFNIGLAGFGIGLKIKTACRIMNFFKRDAG